MLRILSSSAARLSVFSFLQRASSTASPTHHHHTSIVRRRGILYTRARQSPSHGLRRSAERSPQSVGRRRTQPADRSQSSGRRTIRTKKYPLCRKKYPLWGSGGEKNTPYGAIFTEKIPPTEELFLKI